VAKLGCTYWQNLMVQLRLNLVSNLMVKLNGSNWAKPNFVKSSG